MSRLVVLKLGGRVAAKTVRDALAHVDGRVVVVHGAGPQITEEMARLGLEPTFVRGRRVTTPAVLEVVRASLDRVNAEVCAAIGPSLEGPRGVGAGLSQFRATLGGFFVGVGVGALVLDPAAGLAVGLGWLATAAGRAVSLVVDRNASRPIVVELALEVVVGTLFVLGFVGT